MKLYKPIIIILTLFVISNVSAQNYSLSGNIINCNSNKLTLYKYNFNEKNINDSIDIKDNKISYKLNNLEKGMYNISNKYMSVDFIYNKENIEINYDCINKKNVVIKKSKENELLNEFFDFYETNNLAYTLLSQLQKYYPQKEEFYNTIIDKINNLNTKNINYIDSINKNYTKTITSEILKLYKPNKTDFLDTNINYSAELKNSIFLGDLIISYINTYQKKNYTKQQQENAFKPAIDVIFNTFKNNAELNINVSEFLINKFRHFEFDEISEYIAIKTTKYKNDDCLNNPVLKEKYNKIEALANIELGKKAPNFNIRKKIDLYDIKAEYKVLVFWSSWCSHCEEFIEKLAENNKNLPKNVTIITYSIDFEKNDWKNAKSKFPPTWINRCMCEDDTEVIPDSYAIYATPAIFLLNENNIIIDKPKKFEDIEALIY